MKTLNCILVCALAFAATARGQSSVTKPVGFQTVTIKPGVFNLIGANLVTPTLVAGAIDAQAANSITDNDVDFTTALAGQSNLWVEITSGNNAGRASTITTVNQHSLITEDNLLGFLSGGESYAVRAAHTISEMFGATNSAGLKQGNATTADIVWIPDGLGGFSRVYYASAAPPFTTAGWKKTTTGNTDAKNTPIYHVDGLLIERRGTTNLDITITGVLRTTPTFYGVIPGFNYLDSVYPVGATLGNSGLKDFIKAGNATTADIIWLADGNGGYVRYYYAVAAPPFTTAGWKSTATGNTDKSTTALTKGFILERKDVATDVKTIPDPAIYSGL